ncbi:GntR family transcriptional regulator [Sinanaerobacter chloroacetimidivorans]|uniref:GntR family transcriptional regulator n=1 Tax=Sinanaerobacter chloroacetimidivorans TaxID=2818044 RepID=A0A8J7W3J1_9FIRM|nr:GntR family transcriptional regulator [Sinanaerobacter chloroacetimidivorans]MBR0598265.1 GntR family transcriptional regulator [Sinanaerobacter chloroacetimidivorans]
MEEFLTLKDHVYNYIADQINRGNLLPGEKVNENSISEKLNISRTPVREALIQLSSEGLLENVPRKGFVIKHLSVDEAKETYLIIGVLDGLAASLACDHLTEQNVKEMEYYIGSMDLAIDTGNYGMYYKLQEEFHNVYLSVCPNKSLAQILMQLKKKFLKKDYEPDSPDKIRQVLFATNEEHKEMLGLFRNKNSKELEEYMRNVHWDAQKAYMESL